MWFDYQLDVDFCKTSTWYLQDGSVHDRETSHPSPKPPSLAKSPKARYLTMTFGGAVHGVHEVVAYFHCNPRGLSWHALKASTSRVTRQDGERSVVKRYHVHHSAKTPNGEPDLTNNLRSSLTILTFREHVRLTQTERTDPLLPGQKRARAPRVQGGGAECINDPRTCSGELCCTCVRAAV